MKRMKMLTIVVTGLLFSSLTQAALVHQVTASGFDAANGNTIANITDSNPKTRWAIPSSGWIELELTNKTELSNFLIIPFKGDERQLKFDVVYSNDHVNWTQLTQKISTDADSKNGELFTFKPIRAKYVKFNVYGTNVNHWSAINEIEFNSTKQVKQVAIH